MRDLPSGRVNVNRNDPNQYADDLAVDVRAALSKLVDLRWYIASSLLAGVLAGIIYLHVATPRYSATLRVAPAQQSSSGLGSSLSGVGKLASLAGIDLPTGSENLSFQLYLEAANTLEVAAKLSRNPDFMHKAFESEWDRPTGKWRQPRGIGATSRRMLASFFGFGTVWREPDAARLRQFILERVVIKKDEKSPLATLSFEHRDAEFAASLLNQLHAESDSRVRQKYLERTRSYIEYLSNKLQTVVVSEHRQALAQALSEQEKTSMMASSNVSFAAEPLETAVVSNYPTSPRPAITLGGMGVLGALFGLAMGLVVGGSRRSADQGAVSA